MQRLKIAIQIIITTLLAVWLAADCYSNKGIQTRNIPQALKAFQMSTRLAFWDIGYQANYIRALTKSHDVIKVLATRRVLLITATKEGLRMIRFHPRDWGGYYSLAIAIYFSHKLGLSFKDGGLRSAEMYAMRAHEMNGQHPGVESVLRMIRLDMTRSAIIAGSNKQKGKRQ